MRALPVRRAPEGTPEQDAQPPALSQRGAPPERAATRRDSGVSVAVPWRLREASCEGDATGQAWGSGDAPPPKRPRAMAGESAAAKRPRLPAAHGGGAGTDVKLGPGAVEVHGVGGRLAEALAEGDSNVFAVERILGERRRSGRAQFLIRWLGFGASHDSWEAQDNVSADLVAAFRKARRLQASVAAAAQRAAPRAEAQCTERQDRETESGHQSAAPPARPEGAAQQAVGVGAVGVGLWQGERDYMEDRHRVVLDLGHALQGTR